MIRVKTFNSTGVAPNGRLFAGDLNLIQDQAAGRSDFTQTIDTSILKVGDASLQLLKYGEAEFRMTGSLRTDAIMRGLGGLIAGAFTTTQRNAIAVGMAPYGIIILNTTTNQYEWNKGTDAARNWVGFLEAQAPVSETTGVVKMWLTNTVPTGYLFLDGTPRSRTTYSALHSLISAAGYPYGNGDGSTTFDLPDMRGRIPVAKGTNGDVDELGENDGEAVGNRRPRHKHVIVDPGHSHVLGPTAAGFGNLGAAGDVSQSLPPYNKTSMSAVTGITVGPQSVSPVDGPAYITLNFIVKT